jgi:hypothetical protein
VRTDGLGKKSKQIQESADCKVGLPSLPLLALDAGRTISEMGSSNFNHGKED